MHSYIKHYKNSNSTVAFLKQQYRDNVKHECKKLHCSGELHWLAVSMPISNVSMVMVTTGLTAIG